MSIAHRSLAPILPRWAFVPLQSFYILIGLIGCVSSALAIGQALGWHPLPQWEAHQAPGLFYNPAHTGAALAMIAVVMVVWRMPWLAVGTIPGLYLAHSRGGWAALIVGLLATKVRQPLVLVIFALIMALMWTTHPSPSDTQRLQIWQAAWTHLTFWGNGFGSFWALYMGDPSCCIVHPEYAHNDYLQTVFEFGIWSVIPFAVIAWATVQINTQAWPIFVTFLFLASFTMPLHMPVPAALGGLALIAILRETLHA